MLQKMGDSLKGKKIVAYLLLIPLALVFAIWGATGIVDMNIAGSAASAAKVNGTEVSTDAVREAWSEQQSRWQQQFGGDIPEETRKVLQDNLLETFVRRALISERTADGGYRVDAARLREAIEQEPAFQVDGKYNEQLALARLAQVGLTPERYRADVRRDLQNAELERALVISDFATRSELTRRFSLEDEQREIAWLVLPAERYTAAVVTDDAAVSAFYEQNQALWTNPESVRLQYAELRADQVAATVTVTEADLQDLYAQNREIYVTPERRRSRHILIPVDGGDEAAARKQAESVLAEVRAGKDFAALARQYSKDAGSAQQGGDLGWSDKSAFVGPFADALFAMKEGETSDLVKTEFGFHIIRLDGIQPSKVQSFEEARLQLEDTVRRDKVADLFGEKQEQVERKLESPGADLAAIAAEVGLTLGEVPQYLRGAGGAPLGANPEVDDVVFSDSVLNLRRIGGPIALGEDRFIVVKVLEHRKAAPKPLAEVRDAVVAALRKQKATEAARAAADAAVARVRAGESLPVVARAFGVTAETPRFVGRGDPSVSAKVLDAAFAARRPQPGAPVVEAVTLDQDAGAAVLVLTQARVAPQTDNSPLRTQRIQQAAQQAGRSDAAAYVLELRRKAKVEKNPTAFE
ncbi:MAG: peptidyl-prolyl cis-trans isomerase [Steroidobacteraceae bacterium]